MIRHSSESAAKMKQISTSAFYNVETFQHAVQELASRHLPSWCVQVATSDYWSASAAQYILTWPYPKNGHMHMLALDLTFSNLQNRTGYLRFEPSMFFLVSTPLISYTNRSSLLPTYALAENTPTPPLRSDRMAAIDIQLFIIISFGRCENLYACGLRGRPTCSRTQQLQVDFICDLIHNCASASVCFSTRFALSTCR